MSTERPENVDVGPGLPRHVGVGYVIHNLHERSKEEVNQAVLLVRITDQMQYLAGALHAANKVLLEVADAQVELARRVRVWSEAGHVEAASPLNDRETPWLT